MEYSFSSIRHDLVTNKEFDDEFALGFKHSGTWWKVENLDKDSGMFDRELENNLFEIRKYLENTGLPAWHPPAKTGFFRHLVARKSYANNQLLFNLVTSGKGIKKFDVYGFNDLLTSIFKNRKAGLIHTINDDVADRSKLENGKSKLIDGNSVIVEEILGLEFEISMESFFQTNPKCAEKLYQKVIDYSTDQVVNHVNNLKSLYATAYEDPESFEQVSSEISTTINDIASTVEPSASDSDLDGLIQEIIKAVDNKQAEVEKELQQKPEKAIKTGKSKKSKSK